MNWEYLSVKVSMTTMDPGIRNCDFVAMDHKRSDLVEGQIIDYKDPSHRFAALKLIEIGDDSVTVAYKDRTIVVEKGGWRKVSEEAKDYTYFELELALLMAP